MLYKKFIAAVLLTGVIFTGTVEAYDLPKIRVDKKVTAESKKPMLAGDWTETTRFLKKLEKILSENKTLSVASPERTSYDKNRVFIAFYKGNAYFLDKYSVQVTDDSAGGQSWTQRIFPIGENVSPKNAQATEQKFFFDGKNFYNSLKKNNPIDAMADADDRNFMNECFKVGYYFAFGEELDKQKQ